MVGKPGFEQDSDAPAGPEAIAKVTVPVSEVTTLALASSTETTGEVVKSVASPTFPYGWVVKTRWLAVPAVMLKALALTGGVRTGLEVAARV